MLGQLAADEFDLIVLDHNLPGGTTGLEFYTQLRAEGHDGPEAFPASLPNATVLAIAKRNH